MCASHFLMMNFLVGKKFLFVVKFNYSYKLLYMLIKIKDSAEKLSHARNNYNNTSDFFH